MKIMTPCGHKTSGKAALLLMLSGLFFGISPLSQAQTEHLVIDNGNNALSNEQARQEKEQWDQTHRLRGKINSRKEKEFDKSDRASDNRDNCEQGTNVNAYWEPNTLRCLDRNTGRPVLP